MVCRGAAQQRSHPGRLAVVGVLAVVALRMLDPVCGGDVGTMLPGFSAAVWVVRPSTPLIVFKNVVLKDNN